MSFCCSCDSASCFGRSRQRISGWRESVPVPEHGASTRILSRASRRGSASVASSSGQGLHIWQAEALELRSHRAQAVCVQIGSDHGTLPCLPQRRGPERCRLATRCGAEIEHAIARANAQQQRNGFQTLRPAIEICPARNACVRAGLPPLAANADFSSLPGSMRRPNFSSARMVSSRCSGAGRDKLSRGARLFASSSWIRLCVLAEPREPSNDDPGRDASGGLLSSLSRKRIATRQTENFPSIRSDRSIWPQIFAQYGIHERARLTIFALASPARPIHLRRPAPEFFRGTAAGRRPYAAQAPRAGRAARRVFLCVPLD